MNTNCKNTEGCDSCDSCYSCNYCYYCYYCDSCYSCDSCDSCGSCYSCYSCNSCYSCGYCYYCDSCGSCGSCYYSSGLRMSERMLFCLGEGKWESKGAGYQKNNQIFNTQVTKEEWDTARNSLPTIKIGLTKWVDKKDMTKQEKEDNSVWKETGGYLKRYEYKEAWANWWADASKSDKQAILDLPHFDKDIFTGITGIEDFDSEDTIEIEGKSYSISEMLN